jgi:hypothetical protein
LWVFAKWPRYLELLGELDPPVGPNDLLFNQVSMEFFPSTKKIFFFFSHFGSIFLPEKTKTPIPSWLSDYWSK